MTQTSYSRLSVEGANPAPSPPLRRILSEVSDLCAQPGSRGYEANAILSITTLTLHLRPKITDLTTFCGGDDPTTLILWRPAPLLQRHRRPQSLMKRDLKPLYRSCLRLAPITKFSSKRIVSSNITTYFSNCMLICLDVVTKS